MDERIPNMAEKARLDALRLECLKLAHGSDNGPLLDDFGNVVGSNAITAAREMFDYVTDAPKRPELFAVQRMSGAEAGAYPDLGPLNYLSVRGDHVAWDHQYAAYRFRSKTEAEAAIAKYETQLGGVMLPVQLPSYMDLF